MEPFDFWPRTRVVFGQGVLSSIGSIARSLGGHRALVVSDPGIVEAGYPAKAARSLRAEGLEAFLFHGVEENPTSDHVNNGLAFARENDIDLLIGLGGGSSMDCAKAINFVLTNGGDIADYWGVGKTANHMLPLIAVPTTAGTGSEAQSFAVISERKTHRKMAIGDPKAAPSVALLDPEVTVTQPPRVSALTGIDAASHAIESWVTRKRTPISQLYSKGAWRTIRNSFLGVLNDPKDLEARAGMLLGANLAGTAIENSMLGAAHACANPLTSNYGVVHGAAVGLMLPAVIRFNAHEAGPLYDELAACSNGAEHLSRFAVAMMAKAGLPMRLHEYEIPESDLERLAEQAAKEWTGRFNPRPVTAKELLEIYRCVY